MTKPPVVIGVDGGTEGLRVGVYSLQGDEIAVAHAEYATQYPEPGWAEQEPSAWWRALCKAMPAALSKANLGSRSIAGMAVDTTCCTVCCLDRDFEPLRPALLWMDVRAKAQASSVAATSDAGLIVNNQGRGPVSAEWMIPKALWIKENEPEIYDKTTTLCEYQDYLNYRLTGKICSSMNNTGVRWHFQHARGGLPMGLLKALGATELAEKWPQVSVAPGTAIGPLSRCAANDLGLPQGITVVQGGADAFIAMAGVGVVRPGDMALITGSSHLQLVVTDGPKHGRGIWGSYSDVLCEGTHVIEGGQTSTGAVISWFRRNFAPEASYAVLDAEAAAVPIGCEGLTAQDHFQGNRTPYTDAASCGAFTGLSLQHTRGHLFRALLESVAFGSRLIFETMQENGVMPENVVMCGGVTRSPLWSQIHADVLGVPLKIAATDCAPALGSAMFAAIGAGLFANLNDAATAMAHSDQTIQPDKHAHAAYCGTYQSYKAIYPALKTI